MHQSTVAIVPTNIVADEYDKLTADEQAVLARLTPRQRLVLAALAERSQPFCWGPTAVDLYYDVAEHYPHAYEDHSGVGVGVILGALKALGLAHRDTITDCDGRYTWRASTTGKRVGAALAPDWPE